MCTRFVRKVDISIPEDVPRGHVVVYVGEEECKRYVIKLKLLRHPLFRELLDLAAEVFEFTSGSKLQIPCNENKFQSIVCLASLESDNCCFSVWFCSLFSKMRRQT